MRRFVLASNLALGMALSLSPVSIGYAQQPVPQPVPQPPVVDSSAASVNAAQIALARKEGAALGAKQHGWIGRSFALGMFTAYVGPAILIPLAASWEYVPADSIRQQLAAKGPVYQAEFERAYRNKVRVKRTWTTVTGSVLGMGMLVVMFLTSSDS